MPLTSTARRTLLVLGVAVGVAAPAVVLRALCVGSACERRTAASARVPFCSLPASLRTQIQAGFRDGRSPDILAVTGDVPVEGSSALRFRPWSLGTWPPARWPSIEHPEPERVPVIFWGAGVAPGPITGSHTLADVATTIAEIIGLDRPHPQVRSGRPIPGVASGDDPPRLVLQIVLEGVGTDDLERLRSHRWADLRRVMDEGAGTTEAMTGSLPLDSAAIMATIGTGGLPREHGITGTLLRNDEGRLVEAWGPGSPFSVIAALGDDLDELLDQRPRIALVSGSQADKGLIGGNWYLDTDRDDLVATGGHEPEGVQVLLDSRPYAADEVPDLLTVVLPYGAGLSASAPSYFIDQIRRVTGDELTVVVVGTGSSPRGGSPLGARAIEELIEEAVGADVVEATAVGGVFLDQEILAEEGMSKDDVVGAMAGLRIDRRRVFADVFPSIAVSLARYC